MRLAPGIMILIIGLSFQSLSHNAHGRTTFSVPGAPLSNRLAAEDTSVQQKYFFLGSLKTMDRPAKAALLSAAIPGLGQAYNKAYWKIPVIYATGGVLGYFIIDNNKKYQDFKEAVIQRRENTDKYQDHPEFGINRPNNLGTSLLSYNKDYYRRNRDLTIILSVLAYGMNISEAYVHAHMKQFDVSYNLSLRMQPGLLHIQEDRNLIPGLSLTLYTRTR